MTLIEGVQYGPSGGAPPKTVLFEMTSHGSVVVAVVRLEYQQVVGLAIYNALGNIFLSAQGIERHPGIFQHQTVQPLGNGCDLVRLVVHAAWTQHQTPLAGPGADQMQRRLLPAPVEGTAQRLAVDGHHLPFAGGGEHADPGERASQACGSTCMNTRRKVSWEEMSLGRARNWRSQGNLLRPYRTMSSQLSAQAITAGIPPRKNCNGLIEYDKMRWKQRHKLENLFAKLKDWRRVATRYDRCAHTFFSAICIAATVIFYLN